VLEHIRVLIGESSPTTSRINSAIFAGLTIGLQTDRSTNRPATPFVTIGCILHITVMRPDNQRFCIGLTTVKLPFLVQLMQYVFADPRVHRQSAQRAPISVELRIV